MKKIFFSLIGTIALQSAWAQNVGIGTPTPAAKLDVKATSSYVAQFNGIAPMYMGIFEGDLYRGYWGSYSGAAEDVDFGTGSGTTGKLHLTIQSNPRLTINNLGNVGIGTTSPNHLLHVNGGDLFVQSSSGKIRFGYDGSNEWQLATTGGGADLRWYTTTDGGTTIAPRHYFSQNGNVGLGGFSGAGTPDVPLHIKGTTGHMLKIEGNNPFLSLYDNTDGYKGYLWYNGSDIVLGSVGAANRIRISANYNTSTSFYADGRVVIGTSSSLPAAGFKLSVDGKAICEELKVQLSTAWPDYVFEDNYTLPSLEDLEKKVMEEKHLPNIPSANDVEAAKGFEVGEMQNKLLEKVEELYRYVFQLNNENKAMKAEIKLLGGKRK